MEIADDENINTLGTELLDEEIEEAKMIEQLINVYKSNKASYTGENTDIIDRDNIVDNFLQLLNNSKKVSTKSLLDVHYDKETKQGYLYGTNKNGFIKFNNGRSFNNSLHVLNPFEIVYNIERLSPITLNLLDRSLIYNYSIENAYNLIDNKYLNEYKAYTYFKRLGYAITYDFWEIDE